MQPRMLPVVLLVPSVKQGTLWHSNCSLAKPEVLAATRPFHHSCYTCSIKCKRGSASLSHRHSNTRSRTICTNPLIRVPAPALLVVHGEAAGPQQVWPPVAFQEVPALHLNGCIVHLQLLAQERLLIEEVAPHKHQRPCVGQALRHNAEASQASSKQIGAVVCCASCARYCPSASTYITLHTIQHGCSDRSHALDQVRASSHWTPTAAGCQWSRNTCEPTSPIANLADDAV